MLAEIAREELDRVLEETADSMLAEGRIDRPPVDVLQLAGQCGSEVVVDRTQQVRARVVRLPRRRSGGETLICLRPEDRIERIHWAVAHELGESRAHQVFIALGIDFREIEPAMREWTANQLANRLLLPGDWFFGDAVACNWDLFALKRRYRTASHELIARRMLDHPRPVVITVYDQGRVTFRGGNFPHWPRQTLDLEDHCRREAHARCQPVGGEQDSCAATAWPVHEQGWKREIVRLEVPERFE